MIEKNKYVGTLPPGDRLSTSDSVSMYTNIDPDERISTIKRYID